MRRIVRFLPILIVLAGLACMAVVIFPKAMEPWWTSVQVTATLFSTDLPDFGKVQDLTQKSLVAFVLTLVVYALWIRRRFRSREAEYEYQTGFKYVRNERDTARARVQELEVENERLRKVEIKEAQLEVHREYLTEERDDFKERLARADTAEKQLSVAKGMLQGLLGDVGDIVSDPGNRKLTVHLREETVPRPPRLTLDHRA